MIVSHLIKPLYSVYLQCRSSAQLLCTVCLILVLATSGGSTGYAVYATAYPAIEPCVLRLARLERPSLARVDSPACLTVTYDSIEETYRFQGQPTNEYSLFFFEEKRILPIGRTRGVQTTVAVVLYLYIVARLININIT
jgi:hypothetical protein